MNQQCAEMNSQIESKTFRYNNTYKLYFLIIVYFKVIHK